MDFYGNRAPLLGQALQAVAQLGVPRNAGSALEQSLRTAISPGKIVDYPAALTRPASSAASLDREQLMTNMRLNVGAVKQRFMLGATPVECNLQRDELARKIALIAQYPFTSAEDLFEALHLTSITLHDTDRMRRFLAEFRTPLPGIIPPLEFSWDPMARAYTDQRISRGQSSRPQSLTRDVSHERQRGPDAGPRGGRGGRGTGTSARPRGSAPYNARGHKSPFW